MSVSIEHIVVGLSGGVDSAVAAALLVEQGYRVTGLFMKNWEDDDKDEYCSAAEDLADAESVCSALGIELKTINFSYEYWERVFTRFLHLYKSGCTPNPDILCNKEIKFKEFLDYAQTLGADRIATGHYAGLREKAGEIQLLRGRDAGKDQSYFLYAVKQSALARSLFPLHRTTKSQVRHKAKLLGFSIHNKKDSTGICFIGERRFKDFLSRYLSRAPGPIRSVDGINLGEHDGLMFYTIGQRQGLGIGGAGNPWYVASKDTKHNVLYAAQGHDHPALYSTWLQATELSWVSAAAPAVPLSCTAKIRYRQIDQACVIDIIDNGLASVRFEHPQWAVTPGQSVVFYHGDQCLGGGTIVGGEALELEHNAHLKNQIYAGHVHL